MLEIKGEFNTARIYADVMDEASGAQIQKMMDHPAFEGGNVRIMPDFHAGAGCCIGFTYNIQNRICPNSIGVDISCGVLSHGFDVDIHSSDLEDLDRVIRNLIPFGMARQSPQNQDFNRWLEEFYTGTDLAESVDELEKTICYKKQAMYQIGTMGGNNHYIEAGYSSTHPGRLYITVHSGSRNFGLAVANFYQAKAVESMQMNWPEYSGSGMMDLAFLERGTWEFDNYVDSMRVAQQFASLNRKRMLQVIRENLPVLSGVPVVDTVHSVHNYVDSDTMILRKGAISAASGQRVLIPFNMRDGMIIETGLGNPDWNNSAPHGAGRLVARGVAKRTLSMDKFHEDMKGIYSSCIGKSTLDESPSAYKDSQTIAAAITDTVRIDEWVRPLYNFKASEA